MATNKTTPLRLFVIVSLSLFAVQLLRDFGLERIYVATRSMEPTMPTNSRWWMDKITMRFRPPGHGEVIVFQSPLTAEKELIKRVIAIGGDKIEMRQKMVFLNGQKLKEKYVEFIKGNTVFAGDNMGPLTVPMDYFFVLGDNRDESGDSRTWRDPVTNKRIFFIPRKLIRGRILGLWG